MLKKWVFAAFFVVLLALSAWRFWPRPVSDEEQIARNIAAIQEAANNRRAGDATFYLADDFFFGAATKDEIRAQLAGAFFQYRVVNLEISGVQTRVSGDFAQSKGQFVLRLKREFNGPEEAQSGSFEAKWRKIEGQWKVDEARVERG